MINYSISNLLVRTNENVGFLGLFSQLDKCLAPMETTVKAVLLQAYNQPKTGIYSDKWRYIIVYKLYTIMYNIINKDPLQYNYYIFRDHKPVNRITFLVIIDRGWAETTEVNNHSCVQLYQWFVKVNLLTKFKF